MLKIRMLAGVLAMAVVAGPASAGCLTGAAVGAVAGHLAGHHAVLGGAAGCAIGHHEKAVSEQRDRQQSQNAADQSSSTQH